MSQTVAIKLLMPGDLARFRLPPGVNERLTRLLDRQDAGHSLSQAEREEASGLVDLSEMLALLRLRAGRASSGRPKRS